MVVDMVKEYTTIAVSMRIKEQIKEYGHKGESYEEIIERLLKSANERQLQDLLFDPKGTVPIEDAIKRAKQKWQK